MSSRGGATSFSRRAFLSQAAGVSLFPYAVDPPAVSQPSRREAAYRVRLRAAERYRRPAAVRHRTNGDEERYGNNLANFSKGLPHNVRGEMSVAAYGAFVDAVTSGRAEAIERIRLGNAARLVNPQAAFCYVLEGPDPQELALDPPPAFESEATAAEMAELYWQALLRDVPFASYTSDRTAEDAARDLAAWGVLPSGAAADLFRATVPGVTTGPYVSQFLWHDVRQGALVSDQRIRVAVPEVDYLFTSGRWLAVQNGEVSGRNQLDPVPRYIRTGRDLASYVHHDYTFQAFLNACLILLAGRGAADRANPYLYSRTQAGFCTFGDAHILDLVARVANVALKGAWYQKWLVHRRLRPEEFGGRVHRVRRDNADYPVHRRLLDSRVLDAIARRSEGTYFLTQVYPEGAPLHPAYPAGHAVIAGACATVLKAFFDESMVLADAVVPDESGRELHPYEGPVLTVGGELNKLAVNISLARNFAGIHWRSDAIAGLRLGETVALEILADMGACFLEPSGLAVTTFDGRVIRA